MHDQSDEVPASEYNLRMLHLPSSGDDYFA